MVPSPTCHTILLPSNVLEQIQIYALIIIEEAGRDNGTRKHYYFVFIICFIAGKGLFILRWNDGGDKTTFALSICICYLTVWVGQKFGTSFIGWFWFRVSN